MKSKSFEEQINTLSLVELSELSCSLSAQSFKAKYNSAPNANELERQLLMVQNRITALKIRIQS